MADAVASVDEGVISAGYHVPTIPLSGGGEFHGDAEYELSYGPARA